MEVINPPLLKNNYGFYKKIKTMNIQNKKDVTIYDFTIEVENKIKEIYSTKEQQEKALLLVYLVNRANGLGYQLNVRNHRAFYGNLNGVKWNELFQPLIENNIIVCTSTHEVGTKSKTYTTTKQYKWKANTGVIKRRYYGEEYKLMPQYIQKFHLDNHLVVNPNKSLWSNNYQYISKEIMTEEERDTIQDLKNKIFFIYETMDLMKIEIEEIKKENNELKQEIQNLKTSENNEFEVFDHRNTTVQKAEDYNKDILNTQFFNGDENDIDFGEDLFKKVEALIMPDEEIDFTQIFEENENIVVKENVKENILTSREVNIKTIIRRHFKGSTEINLLTNFLINNEEVTVQGLLNTGVAMSGATANRLLNDFNKIDEMVFN